MKITIMSHLWWVGRAVYGAGLENQWEQSLTGSNPVPTAILQKQLHVYSRQLTFIRMLIVDLDLERKLVLVTHPIA